MTTHKDNGFRYWRWRFAIKRPQWALDRHWYVFVGQLGESLRLVLHYFDVMSSYPKAMMPAIDPLDPTGPNIPKGAYGRMLRIPNPRFDPTFIYRWLGAFEAAPGDKSPGVEAMRRFRSRGQTS